jgi:hypothetical protein
MSGSGSPEYAGNGRSINSSRSDIGVPLLEASYSSLESSITSTSSVFARDPQYSYISTVSCPFPGAEDRCDKMHL